MATYYVLSNVTINTTSGPKQYLPGDQVDSSSEAYASLSTANVPMWPAADTTFANTATRLLSARSDGSNEVDLLATTFAGIASVLSQGTQANASNVAVPFIIRTALPAGGAAGTADYVAIMTSAPFKFRVLEAIMNVTTAVGASTVKIYSTSTGSNGTAYTDSMSSASAVQVRSALSSQATQTVAVGGALYAVRSDRSMVGDVVLYCLREA